MHKINDQWEAPSLRPTKLKTIDCRKMDQEIAAVSFCLRRKVPDVSRFGGIVRVVVSLDMREHRFHQT